MCGDPTTSDLVCVLLIDQVDRQSESIREIRFYILLECIDIFIDDIFGVFKKLIKRV